jgi:type I restriction-modification system DNA methylase subunit
MAKKEVKTDLWVYNLLHDAHIELEPQGSSIKEINDALKTASKKGTGKVGFPEYVGVVKDYLLVIEDKADINKHIKLNGTVISMETTAVTNYAVNGALFYAQHLARYTTYKKILAFGVSGNKKNHRISPIYVDETEYYRELPELESFISFTDQNIDEYYVKEILKEDTDKEKEVKEILKDAEELHEDLRNYSALTNHEKPLIVSGILLALRERDHKNFSIENLNGGITKTDGQKIYDAIADNLQRSKVAPAVKKDKILTQFAFIKDKTALNEIDDTLGKTPLKYYTEFLDNKIYKSIRYINSAEDYLGRFYGEFMSYAGGDGQELGIVLTPKHIIELFCELANLQTDDIVLDPCCGTAGFLIAAMHHMISLTDDTTIKDSIRQKQLHGFEFQPHMFTIATTNMILRGDGKSNLIDCNFLKQETDKVQLKCATVGFMTPPYSQGSSKNPHMYEICFAEHLLDCLSEGAKGIVIIPQSSVTGKTTEEKNIKANILKHHTLEGVITLNKDTFYGVGVLPCIAIFTAGKPHPYDKLCKFINFENDGYRVAPHVGLISTESAKDKKQHLLDVWFDRMEDDLKFCVKTTIKASDEWLHSFYYFNDEIPTKLEFEKAVGDYLSFEFSMIMQNRNYLFAKEKRSQDKIIPIADIYEKNRKEFDIESIFNITPGKRLVSENMTEGKRPFIGATDSGNGITNYILDVNESLDKNVLGVNYDGNGMVISFYHPYECLFSDSVKRFHFKDIKDNKYVFLFFKTLLLQQKSKYNYGYKFNGNSMKRQKLMVPVTEYENPDYIYMEQYIKNLFILKYQAYLNYLNLITK